jgi:alpha-galactosidase
MHGRLAAVRIWISSLAAVTAMVAEVPPKGWNSWDGYQGDLDEKELMKVASSWSKLMLPSGYDTLTIDEFWYPDDGKSPASVDEYGRAVVDTGKWPSAAGGKGFKPIADQIHALGLKLGIHVMHGIPKQAMDASHAHEYTVLGNGAQVSSLSDGTWCPWNDGWGRVNMSAPGAQEYFDSIYAQYAEWGIDYIKNDCVFGEDFYLESTFTNIRAAREAMDKSGRAFVYSLSPGFDANSPKVRAALEATSKLVNMYRMTSDWHGWDGPVGWDGVAGWPNHFELAGAYYDYIGGEGAHGRSWPDLDMLNPFKDKPSMIMQQTLWAIARSPLIYGGRAEDITSSNPHIAILTNPRVLAVSEKSTANRQVRRIATEAVWAADIHSGSSSRVSGGALYVALFCLIPYAKSDGWVNASFDALGIPPAIRSVNVTDLWSGVQLPSAQSSVGARLTPCSTSSKGPCSALFMLSW